MSTTPQDVRHGPRVRCQGSTCIDPQTRRRLARERHSRPGFVYHLYIASQDVGAPSPTPRLWRTYRSYELANHDALCWIMQQQKKEGAKVWTCYKDWEYDRKYEGRCVRIYTNWELAKSLGKIFTAITTENRLY